MGKRQGGQTYYYLVTSARVQGKPRIVSQQYLGSATEVMAKLAGTPAGEPLRTQHKKFGDLAAVWSMLERLDVAGAVDALVPRRADAAASVGTYIALATANRVVAPCSKLAFADWWAGTADPDSVVNEPADFSWEAYWSIHLPGGQENHVTRPLVIQGSPEAPEGLTATAGDGPAVTLEWSGPIFPPPVIAYVVERAADKGFRSGRKSFMAAADATSFTDDAAPAGRASFYRVRAEAAAGYSPWSAPAKVDLL